MQPLRKNLRFQLFWLGSAASGLGSTLTLLAYPLLVLALTGSPGQAGLISAVSLASGMLFALPAGVLVDRWDRRRVLLGADLVRAATMASVALAAASDSLVLPHLVAVAIVNGAAGAIFEPAHAASLRTLVHREQLPSAYAQEQTRQHAAELAGPPLGGLLFALGRALPFVVDALTYVVSFVCVALVRVPRRPEEPAPRQSMYQGIAEAVRWMWGRRLLRAVCGLVLAVNLAFNATTIPLIVLVGAPEQVGLVMAALGVGGLIGAAISGRLIRSLPTGALMLAGCWFVTLALPLMVLPVGWYWPASVLFVTGLVAPALSIALVVEVARSVPDHMQGRVQSLLNVATMGITPLAPLVGGVLTQFAGAVPAILVISGYLAICCALATLSPTLRRTPALTE
ncbi:MFS transporter [Nonomuraea endophytica]|uniref:MFS transporter n=1 Tax=Nonomuraea endophytica TaxID=714136 RepID=UPI0028B17744|nr:MFS transporter [Nonomuraea endophytica]